ALPDGAVEVRLRGREPQIVVSHPVPGEPPAGAMPGDSDGDTVRVTLRLPEPLKNAVENAATRASLSVNSWLVRAVKQALEAPGCGSRCRRSAGAVRRGSACGSPRPPARGWWPGPPRPMCAAPARCRP